MAATSYPFLARSISTPDRRVTQYWRATELLTDAHGSSSFAATNGYIVAERTTARPSEFPLSPKMDLGDSNTRPQQIKPP